MRGCVRMCGGMVSGFGFGLWYWVVWGELYGCGWCRYVVNSFVKGLDCFDACILSFEDVSKKYGINSTNLWGSWDHFLFRCRRGENFHLHLKIITHDFMIFSLLFYRLLSSLKIGVCLYSIKLCLHNTDKIYHKRSNFTISRFIFSIIFFKLKRN